jgi:hypothetical protein
VQETGQRDAVPVQQRLTQTAPAGVGQLREHAAGQLIGQHSPHTPEQRPRRVCRHLVRPLRPRQRCGPAVQRLVVVGEPGQQDAWFQAAQP